jgi:hypothetical protein
MIFSGLQLETDLPENRNLTPVVRDLARALSVHPTHPVSFGSSLQFKTIVYLHSVLLTSLAKGKLTSSSTHPYLFLQVDFLIYFRDFEK